MTGGSASISPTTTMSMIVVFMVGWAWIGYRYVSGCVCSGEI